MKKFLTVIFAAVVCIMLLSASVISFAAEEPELVKKTVDFDMSKYEKGTDGMDTELNDWFFIFYAGPEDYSQIVLADDGILKFNNYIHFAMFPELAEDLMKNGYEISLEYKVKADPNYAGIFLRAVDSRTYEVLNPVFGQGAATRLDMYELDWYLENGGKTASKSSVGGSGIRVYQDAVNHKIGVDIKSREEDGIYCGSWGVEFDYPEGYVENELNAWKFIDDGKGTIEIYVCESLICKVLYSGEPDTYPDGLNEDCENLYYKTGKIVAPDGTELLSIDNARIAADTPCFGIGNRPESNPPASTSIKNFSISYFEKPKPTAAPTAEPTEVPTDSGDDATAAPDATTVPGKATEAPKAESSDNTVLIVGIVIGVIVLALIAVIAVILAKKKKK